MVATAEIVAGKLAADGIVSVWDVRSCVPLDPDMLDDAARHQLVVTIEDGIVEGGIGTCSPIIQRTPLRIARHLAAVHQPWPANRVHPPRLP